MNYVGIDISKYKHDCFIMTDLGEVINDGFSFTNNASKPIAQILINLKRFTTGWQGYYSVANMKSHIQALNEWIRRRIRQIY